MNFPVVNLLFEIVVFITHLPAFTPCDHHAFPDKQPISQDVIRTATKPIMDDYLYVDKTRYIPMVRQENPKRLFFSRPRRFGKSVFLRILQAFFQNRKEIFPGTDIFNDTTISWEQYPVMYFDMSVLSLTASLTRELARFKKEQGINEIPEECSTPVDPCVPPPPLTVQQFSEILCTTATQKKRKVVVLVDEYDHFFLERLNDPVAMNETTSILKTWFLQFKNAAEYIELAFVTGVTRSSFLLVGTPGADFEDLSDNPKYAALAGITEEELYLHFGSEISRIAKKRGVDEDVIKEELRMWYNGYSFSERLQCVYNPLSVISYFRKGIAKNYWARAARPTFLWNQLKQRPESFPNAESASGMRSKLEYHEDIQEANPETLLYEAGYFTIKNVSGSSFVLNFANNEVRYAFFEDLVRAEAKKPGSRVLNAIHIMKRALEKPEPDFDTFIITAATMIRRWPFQFVDEEGFHAALYVLMEMCQFAHLEGPKHNVQKALIDIVGETAYTHFLFELKYEQSVKMAFDQANESAQYFLWLEKNVLVVGIDFKELYPPARNSTSGKKNLVDSVPAGWKGELRSPDGTLLKTYRHEDSDFFMNWAQSTTRTTTISKKTIRKRTKKTTKKTTRKTTNEKM